MAVTVKRFWLVLFVPAGNIAWANGWIYLAVFLGFFLGNGIWLLRHNPGLLEERMHSTTADQKGWDKLLFPLIRLVPFVQLIVTSLDAGRYHWSPIPVWLQVVGGIALLLSFYLFFVTFRENSYLSQVVRIQEERGHRVVSTGPYSYVRHPMYAGLVIFVVGTPLLLGSWYGVLLGLPLVVTLMWRAVLEERTLRDELHGYREYMAQVKYRLIPHVW